MKKHVDKTENKRMKDKPYKDKDWLVQKYCNEKLSLREISQLCGVTSGVIYDNMKKHNIPRREMYKNTQKRKKFIITEEELRELYINQRLSTVEIARMYEVSTTTVMQRLKKHNIPARRGKEAFNETALKKIGDSSRVPMPEHVQEALYKATKGRKQSKEEIEKRATALRGPNNPLWKGNRPLIEKIRKCHKYVWWRKEVFERDNYTCVECGDNRGGNLNADHIIPFSYIVKGNGIDSLEKALGCDKLWDTNNGRTLCVKCHKSTDTYGEYAKRFK